MTPPRSKTSASKGSFAEASNLIPLVPAEVAYPIPQCCRRQQLSTVTAAPNGSGQASGHRLDHSWYNSAVTSLATITFVIAALLVFVSLTQPAAERLHLPYTVLLAVLGVA